jgi:YD repeat-containing protein
MRSLPVELGALALWALGSVAVAGAQGISFELDVHDRLMAAADAFGKITRYTRDSAGRLLRTTYPDGRWNDYRYDAQGRLSELRTEQGRALHYRYDPQARWSEVRFPNGDTLRYAQPRGVRGVDLTYPDGSVAALRFDPEGRIERAETPLSSVTFHYGAKERLDALLWSGGRSTHFRYDEANRMKALVDGAGTERRDWEVTLRTAEAGRILTVADALDQMEIRRDPAGRLTSAASAWGWKAFLHWDPALRQPRSMTAPWGYVEFDSRGRPREILTAQGGRVTYRWDDTGRLEQMSIPPLGDLRLGYGPGRLPNMIQLGDGLRTPLRSAERRPAEALGRELRVQRGLGKEGGVRLQYPMPALSAERLFSAQSNRFWSRVTSLVETSSRLPPPGTREAAARDDYWISGKYQNDPYYQDLARLGAEFPTPSSLSAERYLKLFTLTVGVVAADFGLFCFDVGSGLLAGSAAVGEDASRGRRLLPLEWMEPAVWIGLGLDLAHTGVRRALRDQMRTVDRSDLVGQRLDRAEAAIDRVREPLAALFELRDLGTRFLERGQLLPWSRYRARELASFEVVMMDDRRVTQFSSHVIELKFVSTGNAVAINWDGAFTDAGALLLRKQYVEKKLEGWLDGKPDGGEEPGWKAYALRLQAGTRQVLSVIDLLAKPPRAPGSLGRDEARSGVKILRQALAVDLAAVPVNQELAKRGRKILESCPPDQVSCPGVPP